MIAVPTTGAVPERDALVEVDVLAVQGPVDEPVARGEQQERHDDVGDVEEREHRRVAHHPGQHPQRVVLAAARPAELLLGQLVHADRRVGVDAARRLVDGLVPLLEAQVGERAVVAHLEEHAEEPVR